jgi:hypothetical protein
MVVLFIKTPGLTHPVDATLDLSLFAFGGKRERKIKLTTLFTPA